MASTKPTPAQYTSLLDSMAIRVTNYLGEDLSSIDTDRVKQGICDFCYNNGDTFFNEFCFRVGLKPFVRPTIDSENSYDSSKEFDSFIKSIAEREEECIFLLRDTQILLEKYKKITGRGVGVLVNRATLCPSEGEMDYFRLINLLYINKFKSSSLPEFLDNYFEDFLRLIDQQPWFYKKAEDIASDILELGIGNILWVDFGFQFTFLLFCYASVKRFAKGINQDMISFTAYAWLQDFFKEKIFSQKSELVLTWELEGIQRHTELNN